MASPRQSHVTGTKRALLKRLLTRMTTSIRPPIDPDPQMAKKSSRRMSGTARNAPSTHSPSTQLLATLFSDSVPRYRRPDTPTRPLVLSP